MSRGSDARIGLADYLTELQAELNRARAQAEADERELGVDWVTLELDVSFTLVEAAGARARTRPEFWVSGGPRDANDGEGSAPRALQRVTVRMSPRSEVAGADLDESSHAASLLPPARSSHRE
jgi:hypothetical protein